MATMQEDPRETIERCLPFIKGVEDRMTWWKVGASIHSSLPTEEGYALWTDWSKAGSNFNENDQRYTWRKYRDKPGGVGLGSLIKDALEGGMPKGSKVMDRGWNIDPHATKDEKAPLLWTEIPTVVRNKDGVTVKLAATYEYHKDWVVAEYRDPDGKAAKTFRNWTRVEGGWKGTQPSKPLPLYFRGVADGPVYLVEGEKKVDALWDAGVNAACCSNGCDGIGKSDWTALAGREVRLWPDNDKSGRRWLEALARVIEDAGASKVSTLEPYSSKPSDAETGEDVVDWLRDQGLEGKEATTAVLALPMQVVKAGASTSSLVAGFIEHLRKRHDDCRGWGGLTLGPEWRSNNAKQPGLDEALWGLRGLIFLGAAPGFGKTQLALQLMEAVLEHNPDAAVVFFNLEMPREEIVARWVVYKTSLEYRALMGGDTARQPIAEGALAGTKISHSRAAEVEKALDAIQALESRMAIHSAVPGMARDGGAPGAWADELVAEVERFRAKSGAKRMLVVIDNFQAIDIPMGPKTSDLDRDRETVEGITRLQRSTGAAVLVISEVAKRSFQFVGGMGDLLGSGRLPYRADTVMILGYRKMKRVDKKASDEDKKDGKPGVYKPENPRELLLDIAKTRDGGKRCKVGLWWEKDFSRLLTNRPGDIREGLDQADDAVYEGEDE